jgi:hypothetical protein
MSTVDRWVPPKVTLTNLSTGVTLEAQFNPDALEETVSANYAKQTVPGLSHEVLQFSNTTNEAFPLNLFWRAESRGDVETLQRARRFLKSLLYPKSGAEDMASGGPPRVLVVWPGMIAMTCVIMSVKFSHALFTKFMRSRAYMATVQCEEIRDTRIGSDDVFDDTSLRLGERPDIGVPPDARIRRTMED